MLRLAPGVALLLHAVVLNRLSHGLAAGAWGAAFARQGLVLSSMFSAVLYLLGTWASTRPDSPPARLRWAVAWACIARLIVVLAPPMLETDYQRYLWDGAVTASGVNPYRHAPAQVLAGEVHGSDATVLGHLSARSGEVLSSVNHPQLTTIYPPLSQLLFAVAAGIDEFGVNGLRAIYLAFDAAAALLLAAWLGALGLPVSRVLWYVFNPLLLREVYSAVHMDVLVLPLVLGAALAATRARPLLAALLTVAASAVKIWPVLLLPLWIPALRARGARRLGLSIAVMVSAALALWWPVLAGPPGRSNGFLGYGESWQNNDGFFRAGIWLGERILLSLTLAPWHWHAWMRALVSLILAGVVVRAVWRLPRGGTPTPSDLLSIVAALFLLGPTQFPWYWLWCLPILAAVPCLPLLSYTALLPLYELQDRWPWVVWIEHVPVWVGLAIFAFHARARARQLPEVD